MKTEKNLAKVFAMALRGSAWHLRGHIVRTGDDGESCDAAIDSIESVAEELEKYSAAGDAHDWQGSYELLRDAIAEYLDAFIEEDDVAEEAIFAAAVRRAGERYEELAALESRLHDVAATGEKAGGALDPSALTTGAEHGVGDLAPAPHQVRPHMPGSPYTCRACEKSHIPGCIRDRDPLASCPNAPDPAGGAR